MEKVLKKELRELQDNQAIHVANLAIGSKIKKPKIIRANDEGIDFITIEDASLLNRKREIVEIDRAFNIDIIFKHNYIRVGPICNQVEIFKYLNGQGFI